MQCRGRGALRACVNCRKRKSRCTGAQPCSYRTGSEKSCVFEEPVERTPITRRNLTAAELRVSQLEALLRSLHPDLDIEAAIAQLGPKLRIPQSTSPPGSIAASAGVASLNNGQDQDHAGQDENDAEEQEGSYGWHEDTSLRPDPNLNASPNGNDLGPGKEEDGMGAFSTSHSGYLGSSSGSSLLRDIAVLLPHVGAGGAFSQDHESRSSPATAHALPLDRPELASSAVCTLLIDAYFSFYNTSYPIVHEKSFRDKAAAHLLHYGHEKKHSNPAWSIVYYMVLALGHWVSCTVKTPRLPSPFYSAARTRMSSSLAMLESGSLETLQAFLLMGNYLQKRDRPNTAYNLIGIAVRLAFGLGLHREVPKINGNNPPDNMFRERRRQLFWTVYCFDSGFNITTGRPPTALEGFADIALPRNVDDTGCTLTTGIPQEVDHPTPCSAIIAQARLAKIANAIYSEFLMARTAGAKIAYQVADAFAKQLAAWRQELPAYFYAEPSRIPGWFLGPRSVVLWKFHNLGVLLWHGAERRHPFLPSDIKPAAARRCSDMAMQSIHEIAFFCFGEKGAGTGTILHLGLNWYATYFSFQAALVVEACRLKASCRDDVDQEACRVSIESARNCLDLLAKTSSSAGRCLEVLDRIRDQHNSSAPLVPAGGVQPGPNDQDVTTSAGSRPGLPPSVSATQMQDESYLLGDMLGTFPTDHLSHLDGAGFSPTEFLADPTIRMLMDQTPLDFLDPASADLGFSSTFGM